MKPGESNMEILLRAACRRLVAPDPPCCEPDSLAAETGIDPEVARALLPSTEAVLKTVAESALRRQMDHLIRRLGSVSGDNSAGQLVVLGKAFVEWAIENRDDFIILNSPMISKVVDGKELAHYHRSLQELTVSMLERARDRGQLRAVTDLSLLSLMARAFTYGLARLCVDRQLTLWLPDQPDLDERANLIAALEAFADLILSGCQAGQPIRSDA
ncbi:MAG TPA: hypothetical protein PLL33_04670 [Paracoccus sp. (in: a-proteobacteria)]|nr:hypothetical protein [Paracoccus sp. (in: a-proteobacteria)]